MVVLMKGDIFTTKCQTIVNPVNIRGIMESGLSYKVKKSIRHVSLVIYMPVITES